ncbi:MAG: type II toxin-antitoxin system prevent-host-death family antitoxin [Spirochaetota bacterium]
MEQGETVQIFRHVKPVAYLVPIKTHERSRWKTSRPLNIPGVSLSKALLQEREEG